MRIKSRLLKKVKIHKAKDEKVPIAWELGKEIPKLPYRQCQETADLCEAVVKLLKFRISESDEDFWFCSGEIEPIKFEHATLQNVDFEWGTFGRPYRYTPDVRQCPGVRKQIEVKLAEECLINYETLVEFETQKTTKCKAKKISSNNNEEESSDFLNDSELIEGLSYNQQLFEGCQRNPFRLKNLQFKISEEKRVFWGVEFNIPDVVYEHASLQNVEFEWGTWSRPVVRQKPDIRGKEIAAPKVKQAKIETISLEVEEEARPLLTSTSYCVASLSRPDRVLTLHLEIREDKDDNSRLIYKNTKYYCKQCDHYICNGCLTSHCFNHDVQWIGNTTFICECPKHKSNDNTR